MARKSSIEKNEYRRRLVDKYDARRTKLKAEINDRDKPLEGRIGSIIKLSKLPRNSAKGRVRNRCVLTGRPRGFYRKFEMSRIALREHGSEGVIPGLTKSSW
jgi:small subunit ribosomal protein S14